MTSRVTVKVPYGAGAAGVHDALRDALTVEVGELLQQVLVLDAAPGRRRRRSALFWLSATGAPASVVSGPCVTCASCVICLHSSPVRVRRLTAIPILQWTLSKSSQHPKSHPFGNLVPPLLGWPHE